MKISIIGQGYVGLTLSIGAATAGHKVVGLDINKELINDLSKGVTYVPGVDKKILSDLIESNCYSPTTNSNLLNGSEIVVIAVPTPINMNREPDLTAVVAACKTINKIINEPTLIITESTSYPGTLRNLIKPTVENGNKTFFTFAVAPERVDPGNQEWHIGNTTRIISGLTKESTDSAINFYSSFCKSIFRASSPEVAEAAKLLENTFRQVNIALVNEFSEVVNKLGISANEVVNAASTKPFGFMKFQPSIGVGGHCIPIDPEYLVYFAKKIGVELKLTNVANEINLNRPKQVAHRINDYLGIDLTAKRLQIAGISYKPNVSDIRESPALELIKELEGAGAIVSWHDPFVDEYNGRQSSALSSEIDLGLIVTPHSQIDFGIWKKTNVKVLDLSANSNNHGWPKFL